jgi:predicted membrane metal-binding protein
LVGSACVGTALAVWVSVPSWVSIAVALVGAWAAAALDGSRRLAVLALALAAVGLGWGSLRMDALDRSVLATDLDRSGDARLVTLAPARTSAFSTRVLAETRSFRERPVRERVLLKLPVGRSPPRGAILEARVRVTEPSPERNGFDERAWLAHQGIHVVLRASDWRQVGRRGGILGLGDRLRERVERAVSRGTSGVRRGVVLGVVLGEDEDLSAGARNDFRASGLYHLLRWEGRNGLLRECSGMSLERCRSNLDTELWSGFGRVA